MSVRKINFYLDALSLTPDHRKLFAGVQKLIGLQQVFLKLPHANWPNSALWVHSLKET